MPNIFWKSRNGTVVLEPQPFQSEDEFENYLVKNRDVLGDMFILSKQTHSSASGRSDIIGIDRDKNIVLIELKNVPVKEDIISQVLKYALWAETNPDSLKSLWLQLKEKPDELEMNFDNLNIKIMVIAPSINKSVLRFVDKVTYPIDLIEINRYQAKSGDEFIVVNPLEAEPEMKIKPVKSNNINITKEWYVENGRNKESVENFYNVIDKIDKLVKKQGWDVKKKFNQSYVGWKLGFFNVFGVTFTGTKSFALFFKIDQSILDTIHVTVKMFKYENQWSQALYKVDSENYNVEVLLPLFEASMKKITGQ